jgi:hypothetical protein
MNPYSIDVPVLLIFFCREEQFSKVFEQVKIASPSKLFLYQDGPREGTNDMDGIKKCRRIAEDIDWNCEVYKFYQEKNVGCDPSEFIAQKWAFSIVDRCIVLEDDDVPSQSFFPFCKELLERFKDDERINMICGLNHIGISEDCPYDYFFSSIGCIWGWASWRRVIDTWEENYDYLEDKYALNLLKNAKPLHGYNTLMKRFTQHKKTGKAYYESLDRASLHLNNRLNIVPKKNLISNIGISENSTHSVNSIDKFPRGLRRVFYMKTYNIEFPLSHPKYVIDDVAYNKKILRILAVNHPFVGHYRNVENRINRILNWFKKKKKNSL